MARRNDKREKLVSAANESFRQRGVDSTTLANIAELAKVPLGNVYYYFKSKESIVYAVIEHRRKENSQKFEGYAEITDPLIRLQTFVRDAVEHNETSEKFGDAVGGLCQELGRQGGEVAEAASTLMEDTLTWVESQLISLGKGEKARQIAMVLVASMQGINLLALTFKNPNYTKEQADYLVDWIAVA